MLGCYFATKAPADFDKFAKDPKQAATLQSYTSSAEVEMALGDGRATYHTPVRFCVDDRTARRKWVMTTAGRVLFNAIVPPVLGFQNRDMKKKALASWSSRATASAGLAGDGGASSIA